MRSGTRELSEDSEGFISDINKIRCTFMMDAPVEELFQFMTSPLPKEHWHEYGIDNIEEVSDTQYITLNRDGTKNITTTIEIIYPSRLVWHTSFEIGFEVTQTLEFENRQDYVEVRSTAISSEEHPDLMIERAIKKHYKKMILDHLSKKLGRKLKIDFN